MLKDNQPETAAGGPQVQAVDKGHIIPDERRAERSVPSGAAQRPRYEKLPSSYAEALRLGGSQGESRSSDTRNLSRSQSSSGPLSGAGASERQSCTTQKIEGETLPHKEPRKDKGSSAGEAGVDHEHLNHPEQCHENPVTSRIDDIAENSNPNSTAVTVGESGIAEAPNPDVPPRTSPRFSRSFRKPPRGQKYDSRATYREVEELESMRQREKAQRFQLQEQQKENQVLQAQNHQYQLQIDRMTQIVQQLNKQGLPSPPDDGYLADALAGVLSDIRTWTRGANRHLPVFTAEAWNNVESDTQRLINSHFSNFEEIVASNDSKALRLKLLETLIYQRLSKVMLGKQVLGIDEHSNKAMTKLKDAIKSNKASDREMWWWFALSIHLLTKNSDQFEERQSDEVDNLTLDIHDRLMDVGISDRDSLKVQLRDIVLRAAQLGWEVARLPFRIQALSIPPGSKFNASCMEEVENPSDELEIKEAVVKAVMFPPIVKVAFDAEGKVVGNSDFQVLVKARVWCG